MLHHRRRAPHRLLDEGDARREPREFLQRRHAAQQLDHPLDVSVLLVAVERGVIVPGDALEHERDGGEALHVGRRIARELHLVPAVPVASHHLLERLRQPVVHPVLQVARAHGVRQPHRVPRRDLGPGRERGEEAAHVELGDVGLPGGRGDAGEVFPDRLVERHAERAAQRIEQRAVDERRAEARGEAVQPAHRAEPDLRPVAVDPVSERGVLPAGEVGIPGQGERAAQLIEILLVRERGVLVEPLRHQQLGGGALGLAPVLEPDARAHERLRRARERRRAEAERQPQRDVALVERDFRHREARRAHPASSPSMMPRMYPMARAAAPGPSGT